MELKQINYQTGLDVVCFDGHIWMTAKQIEELLEATQQSISYHITELGDLGQLVEGRHIVTLPITRIEGQREVTRQIRHYSELTVIRIGFRANSPKAFAFQEWAAEVILTLKRDGVVYNTPTQPKMEWDYETTHKLLNALKIPPMESLTARIGLLIDSYQTKPASPKKKDEPQVIILSHVSSKASETAKLFLSVIREGLNTGEIYLEGEIFPEYDHRPTDDNGNIIELPKGKLIGFYSEPRDGERAVSLYPTPSFTYVQSVLTRQGKRILNQKTNVWAQLYSAGYINKVDKSKRNRGNIRYDALTYNKVTGKRVRAINLVPSTVLGEAITSLAVGSRSLRGQKS